MSDGNNTESEQKVSDKFMRNLDDIKKKIKENYKSETPVSDSEETREFIKRKAGRKKKDVNDSIENIGTDVSSNPVVLKFAKNVKVENIEKSLKVANDSDKKRIRKRFGHSKLMKYVFHDAFGNKSGVFYNSKSKRYLEKLLDVQINCIFDISTADGQIWRVFGVVEDTRYVMKYHYFEVGYVSCVGVCNAIVLGKMLCEKNNCNLANIRFVSMDGI